MILFRPQHSDILESQGNHWSPCFLFWLTGHVLCPSLSRFYSLFFVLSFFLASIPLKVYVWLPISGYAEVTPFSIPPFGSFSFLPFFSNRAKSHSADLKVVRCHFFFRTSLFWFLEALPTCAMRGRWFFLLFLLGRLVLVTSTLFLIFLFVLFFRTVLIFLWLCLCT